MNRAQRIAALSLLAIAAACACDDRRAAPAELHGTAREVPPSAPSAAPSHPAPRCLDHPYVETLVDRVHAIIEAPACTGWTNAVVIRIERGRLVELEHFVEDAGRRYLGRSVPAPPRELEHFFSRRVRVGVCVNYVCAEESD